MSTQGQWQGQWPGAWFGATEPAPEGSISGSASFGIEAAGTLTADSAGALQGAATFSLSGAADLKKNYMPLRDLLGGGRQSDKADEHERRIARQNELIVALVTAALTEGIMA